MKLISGLLLFSAIIILSGCFTGPASSPGFPGLVPAGHVRLKGTIVKLMKETESDSCVNCLALVQIDSVEGFGARAKVIFSKDTLPVKFMYSLSPYKISSAAEPENSLPGLHIKDIFRGDIETIRQKNGDLNFRIYWYVKINR
jgi:hypothetical protein